MTAVVRVGTAGWSYPDWEGTVYPAGAGRGFDRLAFMAALFDTLEINTSFYRLPDARQIDGWLRRVRGRARFRLSVKAWQGLTHDEAGAGLEEASAALVARLRPLAEAGRLGAVLLQFPFRFRPDAAGLERLDRLAELLQGLPLVAEFRRAAWVSPEHLERLRRRGIGFCNIDQPRLPGNLPPTTALTAPLAYVRLHGRNAAQWFSDKAGRDARYDYLYSQAELGEWVGRVRALEAAGAEEIFVIANNHYRGKAACNAVELKRILESADLAAPEPLASVFPRLGPPAPSRQRPLF